jgi:hypothetical protein
VADYKRRIHRAVEASRGRDAYTGERLNWKLIGRYDNRASKSGRVSYKHKFAELPTVDHDGGSACRPILRICSWRTNDAKNDLSHREFVRLCRAVIHQERRRSGRA